MELSNDRTVSGLHAAFDCDRQATLVTAVEDFHSAEPLPDGHRRMEQCADEHRKAIGVSVA